jgi:hypothetical protein
MPFASEMTRHPRTRNKQAIPVDFIAANNSEEIYIA